MSDDLTFHVIHLENGRLASDTPVGRVAAIAQRAAAHTGKGGIVLHFHGGLVPYSSGMEIAQRLLPVYHDANRGDAYPVFFVWESGLLEILRNNLPTIANEKLFGIIWKRLARIVLRKAAQQPQDRAVSVLPAVDTTAIEEKFDLAVQTGNPNPLLRAVEAPAGVKPLSDIESLNLEADLQGDLELDIEVQMVSNGLLEPAAIAAQATSRGATVRASTRTLMSPEAVDRLVERPDPTARGVLTTVKVVKAILVIAVKVLKRFQNGRHHGFHATLVEEILRELYIANVGGLVWELMKGDTADAFAPDSQAGGTAFLDALSGALVSANQPRITLVGHSTGAVYIAELLRAAATRLTVVPSFDVIFLAPAATCEKAAAMLATDRQRIARFRMFAMRDVVERADHLVPVLYPHSLLYFVSGVVETEVDMPIVGMQHYHDPHSYPAPDFPDVDEVRRFVLQPSPRVVWSTTDAAVSGWCSQAEHHGDFDNDLDTLGSLGTLISGGW